MSGVLSDEERIATVLPFDFCDGGRFLSDPRLTDCHVVGVVQLLGSLVKFSKEQDVPTGPKAKKEYTDHGVVPTLVRKFAEGARADDDIQILKRAVSHSVDPKTPSVLRAQGKVCECDVEIALLLSCAVHASMKDNDYSGDVVVTKDALITASCEYDAGPSDQDNQHLCIHVVAKIYGLVLLLFECLAEHILCELVCRYGKNDPNFSSLTEREHFYDSVKLLAQASGSAPGEVLETTSLAEYLSELNVGTYREAEGSSRTA